MASKQQTNPNEAAKVLTGSRVTYEGNVNGFSVFFYPQRIYATDDIFLIVLPKRKSSLNNALSSSFFFVASAAAAGLTVGLVDDVIASYRQMTSIQIAVYREASTHSV
jgi:hypothetical protein